MTETSKDPKYIRTVGLALLAALLVVASCQVDQPPATVEVEQPLATVEVEQMTPDARAEAIDRAEVILRNRVAESGVEEPPRTLRVTRNQQGDLRLISQQVSDEERTARIMNALAEQAAATRAFIEELQARRAEAVTPAQTVPQELRPEDRAAIQAGPVFTPMMVSPEILNRNEIVATLIREYPPVLRDAGTGGTVDVWFYLSETGQVLHTRVNESSGYPEMDAAALRVGAAFRFSAATNRDQSVPVWIRLPITFEVQN